MFMTAIAWSGRFGLGLVGMLIGSTDPTNILSRVIEVVSVLLIVFAIYALVRIDWSTLISGKDDFGEASTR
jgi:hypothetical protein